MRPEELELILDRRDRSIRQQQSRRAMLVVFVLIPGCVVGCIVALMLIGKTSQW